MVNITPTLPKFNAITLNMGCDPEFFFKSSTNNEVVGAELLLPKDGFALGKQPGFTHWSPESKIIIDGVQAELNPRPNTCRANLANEISACFKALKADLDRKQAGVTCDFSQSIKISQSELSKLDEKNQKFGCSPSLSSYKDAGAKLHDVDPLTYRNRSAGGHIHIGAGYSQPFQNMITKSPEKLVTLLDIIVGNTCVLVDRDPGNKERRKLYGRAGEYRLPKHGLEYRTLSNFWLHAYPLMSLAFGLTRTAVGIACDQTNGNMFYKAFTEAVDIEDVQRAINTNNYALAYRNFKAIEPMLLDVSGDTDFYAFGHRNIKEFHYFVQTVKANGLQHFFKQDPMTHWTTLPEAHRGGFFEFLNTTVRAEMQTLQKQKEQELAKSQVHGLTAGLMA